MARPLRVEFPGAVYHLTARGNARQDIYLDDEDRQRFLMLLSREVEQQGWRCYAYCLMGNHYHLLIETPEGNLVQGMRRLNGVYTQSFNRRHGRVGHVFQGRYQGIVVDRDSHLLELCRYIVLNPVRAEIVEQAAAWPWSSYLATVGKVAHPQWLDTAWLLGQFGYTNKQAKAAYRRFITQGTGSASPWDELRGQMWLGDDAFRGRMEKLLARRSLTDVPAAQRRPTRPTGEEILQAVAQAYKIPPTEVLERSHPIAFQAAVYLLRRAANLSLKAVSGMSGVSAPRISQIQSKLEREGTDRTLSRLLKKYKVKN